MLSFDTNFDIGKNNRKNFIFFKSSIEHPPSSLNEILDLTEINVVIVLDV